MRLLIFILFLLPVTVLADEVQIAVGMDRDTTIALIKKHSGADIGPGTEVVGPKDEFPVIGVFWAFRDYDAIITISAPSGKVSGAITAMTFWRKKDFEESKLRRAQTEKRITVLKIDTTTKEVSIEK